MLTHIVRAVVGAFAFLWLSAGAAFAQAAIPAVTTTDAVVAANGVQLSTRLYAPTGVARYPVVVLVAGSGSESVIGEVYTQIIARAFTVRGIGALAYDKRGTGRSTGRFTGSDFEMLGSDAGALIGYAQHLPQVTRVGLWGISQAGWIEPYAVRFSRGLAFAILVSPGGVNPHEQVSYFLYRQALGWGLTPQGATDAECIHRTVALYYAGRESYSVAQAAVYARRSAPWFHRVVTHPYWDEMTPEGAILDPAHLATALRDRADQFEIYTAPTSFMNYGPVFRFLRLPTLNIYGSADELVPTERSRAVFEAVYHEDRHHPHQFRVFNGASHDIETPDQHVRRDYLDFMSDWAARRFSFAR